MRYRLFFPTPNSLGSTMLMPYLGEKPKDRTYEEVYRGDIVPRDCAESGHRESVAKILERIWQRHNVGDNADDNRPRAKEIRSMCVGDIVWYEGPKLAYVVEHVGFRLLPREEQPVLLHTGNGPVNSHAERRQHFGWTDALLMLLGLGPLTIYVLGMLWALFRR